MSMTDTAIKRIQELGSAPEFLRALEASNLKNPVIALPDSYQLHDLEKHMPNRTNYRGTFSTDNHDEFAKYCKTYEVEGSQCFINVENMTATTIIDLGTQELPGHCDHRSKLSLKATADFKALLQINDKQSDQKTLAEWIEDYTESLQIFTEHGESVEVSQAAAAIRAMTFEVKAGQTSEVNNFSAQQSEYESMAITTKNELPMPHIFKFKCEPYLGIPERTFEMRMSTIGNKTLILRIKQLEQHIESMGIEFKELVIQKLEANETTHIVTYIGTF